MEESVTSDRRFRWWTRIGLLMLAAWPTPAAGQLPALELRFPSEVVAPGGALQMKLENTEPRPISSGGGSFSGGSDEWLGVAVTSLGGDAAAAAVFRGSFARVRLISPSGQLGLDTDYPLLTLTARVPPTAPVGARVPLSLVGGAVFTGPAGAVYPYTFLPGEATVAQGASITNVTPGSSFVAAGGIVAVEGVGFDAASEVRIDETIVTATRFIDATKLEAVLGQSVTMHGREVEVRNPVTDQRTTYFAYQRTTPLVTSRHQLFGAVEVAFPQRFSTAGVIGFGPPGPGEVRGLAVQNIGPTPSVATFELVDADGHSIGRVTAPIGVNTHAVVALAEVFGRDCPGPCGVRMVASAPLQVMGLLGNTIDDTALPVLPEPDTPAGFTVAVAIAEVREGDALIVSGLVTPASLPAPVDVYLVLETPAGQYLSLTPGGLVVGLLPFARRVQPTTPTAIEFLRVSVPVGTAPGTYRWRGALAAPGSLQLRTPIATATFTVTR